MGFNKKAPSSKYCFHLKIEGFKPCHFRLIYNLKLFEDKGEAFPAESNGGKMVRKLPEIYVQVPEIGVCSVDTKSLFELLEN